MMGVMFGNRNSINKAFVLITSASSQVKDQTDYGDSPDNCEIEWLIYLGVRDDRLHYQRGCFVNTPIHPGSN